MRQSKSSRITSGEPSLSTIFFQPKLKVNSPGDKYERQADAMADQVMRMPEMEEESVQTKATTDIQRACAACEQKEDRVQRHSFPEEDVQSKSNRKTGDGGFEASPQFSSALQRSKGGGESLSNDTLGFMNRAFNYDFSGVRIHHNSQAANLSQQIQAKAFTTGSDIYFNKGQYNPNASEGKRLLAHELTHVVQQSGGQPTSSAGIQRDEGDANVPSPDGEESTFDFDMELLPPELQLRIGGLMLQANTGSTELQFSRNLIQYRLGYSYGSDLYFGARSGSLSSRLGVNPSTGNFSLGMRQNQYRFGASVNPFNGSAGFNFGYGASLLPMPDALTRSVYGGVAGVGGMLRGLDGMPDPISYYRAQSDNIDAVMGAVKALRPLADRDQPSFGAGLRFTYNPDTGVLIHAGMQWLF